MFNILKSSILSFKSGANNFIRSVSHKMDVKSTDWSKITSPKYYEILAENNQKHSSKKFESVSEYSQKTMEDLKNFQTISAGVAGLGATANAQKAYASMMSTAGITETVANGAIYSGLLSPNGVTIASGVSKIASTTLAIGGSYPTLTMGAMVGLGVLSTDPQSTAKLASHSSQATYHGVGAGFYKSQSFLYNTLSSTLKNVVKSQMTEEEIELAKKQKFKLFPNSDDHSEYEIVNKDPLTFDDQNCIKDDAPFKYAIIQEQEAIENQNSIEMNLISYQESTIYPEDIEMVQVGEAITID